MDQFFLQISYWVLALMTLVSALMVTTLRNLTRATIFLVFFFLGAAGLYFLLQAEFLALVQAMVYAGAIAVLFAFVIMLTPGMPGTAVKQTLNRLAGLILTGLFVVLMLVAFSRMPGIEALPKGPGISLAEFGQALLTGYLLPFELVSVVLLVALVGAVVYTRGIERGDG